MGGLASIIIGLLFVTQASANIIITEVKGASNFSLGTNGQTNVANPTITTTNPQIFGGTAGVLNNCVGAGMVKNDADSTCNSCTGQTTLATCNLHGVYSNLMLQISFYSTTLSQRGTPMLLVSTVSGTNQSIGQVARFSNGVNDTGTITVLWSDICTAGGSASDCSTPVNFNASLGFSTDGNLNFSGPGADASPATISFNIYTPLTSDATLDDYCGGASPTSSSSNGVCGWRAFPGDNKVYLDSLVPGTGFPSVNSAAGSTANTQMDKLLMFYSPDNFASVTPASSYKTFQLQLNTAAAGATTNTSAINVTPDYQDGLDNGTTYFFRLATQDQAGNIAYFTSDTAVQTACGASALTYDSSSVDNSVLQSCPFLARPDRVFGLLTKDMNCFIASAAYGSALDQHLEAFRNFRSHILLSSAVGLQLNHLYYKYGPYGARTLHNYPWLKPMARSMLWPAWVFAIMTVKLGLLWGSLLFCAGLAAILIPFFTLCSRMMREHLG